MSDDKCPICGSIRFLEGPAYAPEETTCLDCGSQFNRKVMVPKPDTEFRSQLAEMAPIPEGGFSTTEEAMAHLAKLKQAAKQLGKNVETTEDKINKPKRKVHPTSDIPEKLVMAEFHYYQREGESFQQVLATGKGERDFRNENILIFCHNHIAGHQCTATCREVIANG